MNLDTGVISTSSLSIGAWACASPAGRLIATKVATTSKAKTRVMRSSSWFPRLRLRPRAGAVDGPEPAAVGGIASRRRHRGCEPPLELPAPRKLRRLPEPDAKAGEIGGTEARRLRHRRPQHVHAEDIGLELTQEVVGGGAAIDAERLDRHACLPDHRVQDV